MPLNDDKLIAEQIFLGGQVSNKHRIFQEIGHLSPDTAMIYYIMKHREEWHEKRKNGKSREVRLEMIELIGAIEFMQSCTELTRLSMIMGDTRQKHQVKGVMDELRKLGSNPIP